MAPYMQTETQHEELTREILRLWDLFSEKFRTTLSEYDSLLKKRRELGIRPFRGLQRDILDAFPKIPFFEITDYDDAEEYVSSLNDSEIERLINQIQYVIKFDYSYRTIRSTIDDYRYIVGHHNCYKSKYSIDPDSISGVGKRKTKGAGAPRDE